MQKEEDIIFRRKNKKVNLDDDTLTAFNFKKEAQIRQTQKQVQPVMDNNTRSSHLKIKQNRKPLDANYELNNRIYQEKNKRIALSEPISTSHQNTKSRSKLGERVNPSANQNNYSNGSRNNYEYQKPKKKKKLFRKILLLLLLLIVGFVAYIFISKQTSAPIKVAVIGVDARENQDESLTRSDALMFVNVGIKENDILMTSIPRDSYTYVPCEDANDKITHAYVYGNIEYGTEENGGVKCTLESIEQLTSFKVEKYIKMNFETTKEVVEFLGGIEIKPTKTFCLPLSEISPELCLTEGEKIKLNGEQALAYSRHRKSDNDFERGKRQQQVVTAMLLKIKNMPLLQWPSAIGQIRSMVETNLNTIDLIKLSLVMINNPNVESYKFEGDGMMENGVYYFGIYESSMLEFQEKIKAIK